MDFRGRASREGRERPPPPIKISGAATDYFTRVTDLNVSDVRASCRSAGYAAGAHFNIDGSGSNMLCVHEQPQFRNTMEGDQTGGLLSGVQYEMYNSGIHHNNVFDESNTGGAGLETRPVPCAVCSLSGRSVTMTT